LRRGKGIIKTVGYEVWTHTGSVNQRRTSRLGPYPTSRRVHKTIGGVWTSRKKSDGKREKSDHEGYLYRPDDHQETGKVLLRKAYSTNIKGRIELFS